LKMGEIGYIATGAKDLSEILVGDTVVLDSPSLVSPISGFKKPQPMVYASIYSTGDDTNLLRKSLEKLKLNDSSLTFEPENSLSFGYGFRCGFLGLLHLEITKVRLEREYNLDLIVTQPQVYYEKKVVSGHEEYEEPWVDLEIITPKEYLGPIMELAQNKRGIYKNTKFILEKAILFYEMPLSEIIIDFYDKLKSVSSGYASQNYEIIGWRPGDLVKLDIMIAGEKIEEFSRIVPRLQAQSEAQKMALKLKDLIPRQMFEIAIQVAVGGKILARENISAMKKDVTAKLYGGDVTRKNKLLKKQAKGKKRMKTFGRVEIPSNVFIDLLKS
ncbi:MAG: elongation factor 4, partial [Patescibacteria group bacterium]|nr:elongation factor 4 [Patescibacteria group bacterium]